MLRTVTLVQDAMNMKYVRAYKSPDTGWTTFDTMSSKGFRVFVHLTPGNESWKAREELILKATARPVDFDRFETSYRVIARAMEAAASNSYGFLVEETIDPDVIRGRWGLAMFWARNPWLSVPMNWYSAEEVESAIRRHYGVTGS